VNAPPAHHIQRASKAALKSINLCDSYLRSSAANLPFVRNLRSILYPIHWHNAFRSLLITVSLSVVIATISGVAWRIVWKRKPSARGWGIEPASCTF
jgi:hypothetical protein